MDEKTTVKGSSIFALILLICIVVMATQMILGQEKVQPFNKFTEMYLSIKVVIAWFILRFLKY